MNVIRPASSRIVRSITALKRFVLFSHDEAQAYCQLHARHLRWIYPQPKQEYFENFGIKTDEVMELLLPLYGIFDVGDNWGVVSDRRITEELNMTSIKGDNAVYIWSCSGEARGVTGTYVDTFLNTGNR